MNSSVHMRLAWKLCIEKIFTYRWRSVEKKKSYPLHQNLLIPSLLCNQHAFGYCQWLQIEIETETSFNKYHSSPVGWQYSPQRGKTCTKNGWAGYDIKLHLIWGYLGRPAESSRLTSSLGSAPIFESNRSVKKIIRIQLDRVHPHPPKNSTKNMDM